MKTLNFEQMEQVNGGGLGEAAACLGGIGTMAFAVACVCSGPVGLVAAAAFTFSWLTGGVSTAVGCASWMS